MSSNLTSCQSANNEVPKNKLDFCAAIISFVGKPEATNNLTPSRLYTALILRLITTTVLARCVLTTQQMVVLRGPLMQALYGIRTRADMVTQVSRATRILVS